MRIALVNMKGGVGKTYSAVYLAAGLARRGRTLLVDADPQGSALEWSQSAHEVGGEFGFPVVAMPVRDLHRRMKHFVGDFEHLVVDTPPGHESIVRSAVAAVEAVVVPVPPTLMDLNRLSPTLELLSEVSEMNDVSVYAALTRVRRGTRSARMTRATLEEMGLRVLGADVPLLESFAMGFGLAPEDLGEYEQILEEILESEGV